MAQKPISSFKAVAIPAANVAMDRDWRERRMKQVSPCCMMINAKKTAVDRTLPQPQTPQIIHDSSATITTEVASNTLHSPHIPELVFLTLKTLNINGSRDPILRVILVQKEEDFFGVTASSRHLTRFGEGPMAQSYMYTRRVRRQHLGYMRKAHQILQSWHRRLARAELGTKQRLWLCEALRFT